MKTPLDILETELRARGYATQRVAADEATASSKTDALRAIRMLEKALKNGKFKGIGLTALYGVYELARLRTAGKKLSDGQKEAVKFTLKQLRKTPGFFGRLKGFFKSKNPDAPSAEDAVAELESWIVSDEGFGEPPASMEKPAKPKRPRGWAPRAVKEEQEKAFYGAPVKRKRSKKVSPKEVINDATASADAFIGFDFEDQLAVASTASNTLRALRIVEKILASKRGRAAALTTVMGIHGILKKAAKNRNGKLDKTDVTALNSSVTQVLKSPKTTPAMREHIEELKTQLERDSAYKAQMRLA